MHFRCLRNMQTGTKLLFESLMRRRSWTDFIIVSRGGERLFPPTSAVAAGVGSAFQLIRVGK